MLALPDLKSKLGEEGGFNIYLFCYYYYLHYTQKEHKKEKKEVVFFLVSAS